MLVIRRGGGLELLTQPDHAAVAGALAERWGTSDFTVPAARESLICAAIHHDDGWYELDEPPAFNAKASRPAHFTELPLTETVGPYGRGVESVYKRDPLAGALCSMHWSGFSTSRWGAGGDHQADDELAQEVIASQEVRWMPALRAAWGNRGRRSDFDAHVWHAYEVLQAVDLLSLGLSLMDTDAAGDGGDRAAVESSLSSIDQGPGARTIGSVPTAPGGSVVTVTLTALGGGRVCLDPYPLSGSLELDIPTWRIPDRRYDSAQDAASAYQDAVPAARRVRLEPRTS